LVIVRVPLEVIGLPEIDIPAPAEAATLVTVPKLLVLLLKVVQSVLDNKPFCDPVAVEIPMVIVPLDVTGVDPMVTPLVAEDRPTEVTVPTFEVNPEGFEFG
jgi:hypothetical protein